LLMLGVPYRLCYSSHSAIIEHMSESDSGPKNGPGELNGDGAAGATSRVAGTDAGALAGVPLDSTDITSLMTSLGRICDAPGDSGDAEDCGDAAQAEAECIATVQTVEDRESAGAAG